MSTVVMSRPGWGHSRACSCCACCCLHIETLFFFSTFSFNNYLRALSMCTHSLPPPWHLQLLKLSHFPVQNTHLCAWIGECMEGKELEEKMNKHQV